MVKVVPFHGPTSTVPRLNFSEIGKNAQILHYVSGGGPGEPLSPRKCVSRPPPWDIVRKNWRKSRQARVIPEIRENQWEIIKTFQKQENLRKTTENTETLKKIRGRCA